MTRGRTVRGMSRMQNFDYMVAVPFVWIDASRRSYLCQQHISRIYTARPNALVRVCFRSIPDLPSNLLYKFLCYILRYSTRYTML